MNKRVIRDYLRLAGSILFCWLYILHFVAYAIVGTKSKINSDLEAISGQLNIKLPRFVQLIYQLHNNRYFRHVFYFRIGPTLDLLISWYRPGYKL